MKRILILAAVALVAAIAYGAGVKAEKAKKKFPYLSDYANQEVTMTQAELACATHIYHPTEPWKSGGWVVTKIETSLEPNNIALTVQVILAAKPKGINYRSRGHLVACIRSVRGVWLARIFRLWGRARVDAYPPIVLKMYEGKKLIAKMGLPSRDPFGKKIPAKIITIGDKPGR